jgi:prepilin-type N-terminal cleavage/methylation domain-containing protein
MKRTAFARPAPRRGFTLIELLVVIAIIALLVTGAFGAYGFVMEKAKKADAQAACMAVSNGIDQYHTEYDYLPQPTSATKGTDCTTDTGPTEGLINILLAIDVTQNAKKINFIGDIKEAKTQAGEKVNGLIRTEETAELKDPWGNHYKVVLDLDLDEKILNPNDKDAAGGRTELHKQVIVWSPGKDRDEMEWKDNIGSWEFPKE